MTGLRIDVVTVFPDYLAPLRLSLIGRAQRTGLVDIRVHDLRDWTRDTHRTVDDAPYGGGAGMVMRPEPWGEAIDALLDEAQSEPADENPSPVLVVPTPAGARFDQRLARSLARSRSLVVACGRYEGIDQRVADHFRTRVDVLELSIGDYVLGGGEAAALVVVEAVARLLPGVVGNPESLVEESHAGGSGGALLEYPVYTRPRVWRDLAVPDVLLGGDHAAIRRWRAEQAVRRTALRRPDLVHPSSALRVDGLADDAELRLATPADAGQLLVLQRCCAVPDPPTEAALHVPELRESAGDVAAALPDWLTLVVVSAGRLVASVRGRPSGDRVWEIGRLMVAPDLQGRGLGRLLLDRIERSAPPQAATYRLFPGAGGERAARMLRRAGYRPGDPAGQVFVKRIRQVADFG